MSRYIIFDAESMRAIRNGCKTQTRRVMTIKHIRADTRTLRWENQTLQELGRVAVCPYGKPGDLLWVRETWGVLNACYGDGGNWVSVGYKATPNAALPDSATFEIDRPHDEAKWYHDEFCDEACKANGGEMPEGDGFDVFHWRSPIHMPRWASRLTLRLTDVRVQRVQEISFSDCRAEGCDTTYSGYFPNCKCREHTDESGQPVCNGFHIGEKWHYFSRWDAINANRGYPWDSNPWVWALTFEPIWKNIDKVKEERQCH